MEKKVKETKIDLSKVKGSMSSILHDEIKNLNNCKTISDVYELVKNSVGPSVGHGTSETAYKKLLNSIRNSRTLTQAMFAVTNSYLDGANEKVIKWNYDFWLDINARLKT